MEYYYNESKQKHANQYFPSLLSISLSFSSNFQFLTEEQK